MAKKKKPKSRGYPNQIVFADRSNGAVQLVDGESAAPFQTVEAAIKDEDEFVQNQCVDDVVTVATYKLVETKVFRREGSWKELSI